MRPLDFFRRAVEPVERHRRPPSDVMALTAANDERCGPYAPCPCGQRPELHGERAQASHQDDRGGLAPMTN